MRNNRISASAFGSIAVLAMLQCTPVHSRSTPVHTDGDMAQSVPVIDSVRPDSVSLPYGGVVEVTVHGSGFTPGQPGKNTVHFNGAALTSIQGSSDGRRIVFAIPDLIDSGGEAPPSRLQAGSHAVSVETSAGTSNVVTIRVYR
jgi:IPT/TIG domain